MGRALPSTILIELGTVAAEERAVRVASSCCKLALCRLRAPYRRWVETAEITAQPAATGAALLTVTPAAAGAAAALP
jgi:hypothetical protein